MALVLDASTAMSWAMEDESEAVATAAMHGVRTSGAFVPALWWFEIRNALVMNERRGRLTEGATTGFLHALSLLPIRVDRSPGEDAILSLARRNRLTVYDAAYLELSQRHNLALATLDKALARAARAEGIDLVGVAA